MKYDRWKLDNLYLRENYLKMNNQELADKLQRTPDAVRKQLKKLALRRPTKAELKKMQKKKKRGKKPRPETFFTLLETGTKNRKKQLRDIAKNESTKQRKKKEKDWCEDLLNDEKCTESPDLTVLRGVKIYKGLVMFVDPDLSPEQIEEKKQRFIEKRIHKPRRTKKKKNVQRNGTQND